MGDTDDTFRLKPPTAEPRHRERSHHVAASSARDVDPPAELSDDTCEGAALSLLARIGAERRATPLHPLVLAKALHLILSPAVPSGCRGAVDLDAWRLRYDGRGDPDTVNQRLSHEEGHYAAARYGIRAPHAEGSVDRIAMALWLPREAVRAVLRRVGFDPLELLRAFPGVPPAWVLIRAAWVARRPVIVRIGGQRLAYAPDDQEAPPDTAGPWEREVVEIVHRTGHPHRDLLGVEASPVAVTDAVGVLILLRG